MHRGQPHQMGYTTTKSFRWEKRTLPDRVNCICSQQSQQLLRTLFGFAICAAMGLFRYAAPKKKFRALFLRFEVQSRSSDCLKRDSEDGGTVPLPPNPNLIPNPNPNLNVNPCHGMVEPRQSPILTLCVHTCGTRLMISTPGLCGASAGILRQ